MPLHPIAVVDQVLEEYRSYLLTEFRARDPKLRAALQEALDRPLFLAQEAFFQAHRPFKSGAPWRELGLDARLAQAMEQRTRSKYAYLHQSEAIRHLLSPSATPLVVTTGTGSGKTECFLLPVIQNALEDASRFSRSGLTAILVYPMNALANDQQERIREYLEASGHTYVRVARYDRSTTEAERQSLRRNPPHILLTNYMMLEYLLVRPADRRALFANHRCRYVVLDEVHTYRGSLGANIALLFRRLRAHLREAVQDWAVEELAEGRRFPTLLPVATSATIKSVDEVDQTAQRSPEEVRRLRDEAVKDFLSRLTGFTPGDFRVLGEELRELEVPPEAHWTAEPVAVQPPPAHDMEAVRRTLTLLAGLPEQTSLEQAVRSARILWALNELLARKPLSLSQIASELRTTVPERQQADPARLAAEVHAALVAGAALPEDMPGGLRLRTHRFIRGGWRFHRCVDPACGQLYAMGQERCTCGRNTAPLYLCRSCGADALRFIGDDDTLPSRLIPDDSRGNAENEWLLYDRDRLELAGDEEGSAEPKLARKKMKDRSVLVGTFDPQTCTFASEPLYPTNVVLAPARNTCLACGSTANAGRILTSVALGTSAAVRVLAEGLVEGLAEQNRHRPDHDHKERLLIFADSRQDAAHQARFITYAGRYDRMRRRLVRVLEQHGPLSIQEAVQALMTWGVEAQDNPHVKKYKRADFLPKPIQAKACAWEEAPLLDDLALSAGYRATVLNLGLVGVRYDRLEQYVAKEGQTLAAHLGIATGQLAHLARCLLDEMRRRGALSRRMLCYHPSNPRCPEEFKEAADWERRMKTPQGYSCNEKGEPKGYRDSAEVPQGVQSNNFWRRHGAGGSGPSLERKFKHLLKRMGGVEPSEELLEELLACLMPVYITTSKLSGYRETIELLQVNADSIQLALVAPEERYRCTVCNVRMPWAVQGSPCPTCHGVLEPWPAQEVEQNRYVQRIRNEKLLPLEAGEHTAQVTGDARIALEEEFKGSPEESKLNVLSCSPTLEMGIDVGGLDAVVLRNVPPRPDNYAQRGGRAGRRSRVGIVVGYARSTPHDAYFYDKPQEMIAGEVPAPAIGLGNRDVVLRHLNAIALGAAEPGLAGRMGEYLTLQGTLVEEKVEELLAALEAQREHAVALALEAWGPEILGPAGLGTADRLRAALAEQPTRIRELFERVRQQLLELEKAIEQWTKLGRGDWAALSAMELKRRLLGLPSEKKGRQSMEEADDRSAGHPMRRFAEFGLLPGYEFPSEPATLRLLGDRDEDEPITVVRRFGLAQYQPEAPAHARSHRWRVVGLDMSSPWNPKGEAPTWVYTVCGGCGLRFQAQKVSCPRCGRSDGLGKALPGYEFGGFLAVRNDTPVLEEEERLSMSSLLRCFPQWDTAVAARWELPTGWWSELRHEEEVRWVNESREPTESERQRGLPQLHSEARGFYLCPACGRVLTLDSEEQDKGKGRKRARKADEDDRYGHTKGCPRYGKEPEPLAITTKTPATTLRLRVRLPAELSDEEYQRWGQSLGYALRIGMRHLYMLDGPEIEFVLEPAWQSHEGGRPHQQGSLTFIDPAVGGSGFLERAAHELQLVAKRALEHLEHEGCETACYRCLKSYQNQRVHSLLSWPLVVPDLDALARAAPVETAAGTDDPRPWLEAYAAGVGSPLELRFLRLFEQHGLAVDKQVPVSVDPGGPPISVADFVIKGSRVALYVDGAAFHHGRQLRRDRFIRDRLRHGQMGWRVEELQASHLSAGRELVERLRTLAEQGGG